MKEPTWVDHTGYTMWRCDGLTIVIVTGPISPHLVDDYWPKYFEEMAEWYHDPTRRHITLDHTREVWMKAPGFVE